MKFVLAAAGLVLIHGSFAALLIKGPTEPILAGRPVTLECRYSNSTQFNIHQVDIEMLTKYTKKWSPVVGRIMCYGPMVTWTKDSLVLYIDRISSLDDGSYRCVSSATNVTTPDNSSEVLTIKVNYLMQLSIAEEGYRRYLSQSQELKVRAGDDVVLQCSTRASETPIYTWYKNGSDWILPSSKLVLMKVSSADQGQYICTAKHPSLEVLKRNHTITITVLSKDAPWYATSHGQLMLTTSVAAAVLLVFIASVTVFLCRRAKRSTTAKGPIDDHSQKKPIYRTSAESLLSTTADKQPLV